MLQLNGDDQPLKGAMQLFLDACDDGDPSGFMRSQDFNRHSLVFFSALLLFHLPLKMLCARTQLWRRQESWVEEARMQEQ